MKMKIDRLEFSKIHNLNYGEVKLIRNNENIRKLFYSGGAYSIKEIKEKIFGN